ncbi:hypothetical protein [Sphingomonas sp. UYP23]
MRLPHILVATTLLAVLPTVGNGAAKRGSSPPTRIGTCVFTSVREVGQRLEDRAHRPVTNSGSNVGLANGVWGVSYDQGAAVNASRPGDRAMTCLVRLPRNCPAGDQRGRVYTTTNLRTEQSWTLPDAEHQCGAA